MNYGPITTVTVDMPDQTLRDIDELARRKGISRTEALAESVATTMWIANHAPRGAEVRSL